MLREFNYRKYCQAAIILLLACCAPIVISAQDSALTIPAEIKPFVEKDWKAIAVESADLNGDGTIDYVLVAEKSNPKPKIDDEADDARSLLIIVRGADGKLTLAKRNNEIVYCRSCGGVFGDPFAGVDAKRSSFTVNNYGGSAWCWSESYQFNYSRTDKTWQLVRVESESFHASDPNKVKSKIRTPKSFGKVDIADLDIDKIR